MPSLLSHLSWRQAHRSSCSIPHSLRCSGAPSCFTLSCCVLFLLLSAPHIYRSTIWDSCGKLQWASTYCVLCSVSLHSWFTASLIEWVTGQTIQKLWLHIYFTCEVIALFRPVEPLSLASLLDVGGIHQPLESSTLSVFSETAGHLGLPHALASGVQDQNVGLPSAFISN